MKPRKIVEKLEKELLSPSKKILFLWGPRQSGKSTILRYLYERFGGSYFNFDDLRDQRLFVPDLEKLEQILKERSLNNNRFVFIDEVQNNPEATLAIKLLTDRTNWIVFATGSSELRAKTNRFDSLAGRYREFILFPLTIDEVAVFEGKTTGFIRHPNFAQNETLSKHIENILIYGSYPGVVLSSNKPQELMNITQNSIVKDIVNIYDLKNTDLIFNLLRLLAMQIGNLVNVSEVASSLGSTKQTIDNYLSILSKNRVIFFLEPFRTNKRRGFLARKKVFFYDLGIRNSLIEDFRAMNLRADLGAMFENLIVLGAWRQNLTNASFNKLHYYRDFSGSQREIDLIIENLQGQKEGFEIKYGGGAINKFAELGIKKYRLVSFENAPEFLV